MKIEEITLERVKEAYELTGLKPARFTIIDKNRGCALQALARVAGRVGLLTQWSEIITEDDSAHSSMWGFVNGFDGATHYSKGYDEERYSKAYELGRYIAQELGLNAETTDSNN